MVTNRSRSLAAAVLLIVGLGAAAAVLAARAAVPSQAAPAEPAPRTYCNPLPIPDYPVGRIVRDTPNGAPLDGSNQWRLDRKEQYRELADPTAMWHEGRWYLYPSVDMAWVSADMGATWTHHPLNVRDIGYAPTIVRHRGRFLLMASESSVYVSDSPLGPFKELGPIRLPASPGLPSQTDPMLFADDDGRLYYYWGCTPSDGIYVVELDAGDPTKVLGQPREVIPFRPELQPWERIGEHNQSADTGWVEGSWMVKRGDRYILVFSAGGTEHGTYAMGAYTSRSPLGPFAPQSKNPILRTPTGLVTGTAHGSIAEGPGGKLWVFYTLRASVAHGFERRVGMDPVEVDGRGELSAKATATPQWLPGKGPGATGPGDTGWLPLNATVQTLGSTSAANLGGRFAVDEDLRTWWQPADGDTKPVLTSRLLGASTVTAVRVAWRDVGMDTTRGVMPGAFKYRVEVETAPNAWKTVVDRSASTDDLLVDYRECPPTAGARVRLVVLGWPKGITPGVAEFTVFGEAVAKR
jgi:xylan 1,4-beta-xylosidase